MYDSGCQEAPAEPDGPGRARLNCIDHLLKQFPYQDVRKPSVVLPQRERHEDYWRQAVRAEMLVPEIH